MSLLKDKIAFITGASSGIGQSTARLFAKEGAKIFVCGRRGERLEQLAGEIEGQGTAVRAFPLDVRNPRSVAEAFSGLPEEWASVDILVNNAGLSRGMNKLHEGRLDDWEEMIDTNIKGLLYVSREVIPGMVRRGSGHIINIGSIAGYEVYPGGNVYCATKFAVRALSRGLRLDLVGTPVRVSEIAPGMVETEFSLVRFHGDRKRAEKVYQGLTPLSPDDIAEAALWCASRPPHVNISEVIVMPTAQASAMVAHRTKDNP